ncbi:A24 family peptidase C-terminal domain-containing protein, partial [Natronolimnohabitans innermongolicus]
VRSDGGATAAADARNADIAATDDSSRDADGREYDDPWGADAFLEDIDGTAYGTRAGELREGLDVLASKETVWISPGTPFLVPVFLGLLVALLYGDLLVGTIV